MEKPTLVACIMKLSKIAQVGLGRTLLGRTFNIWYSSLIIDLRYHVRDSNDLVHKGLKYQKWSISLRFSVN